MNTMSYAFVKSMNKERKKERKKGLFYWRCKQKWGEEEYFKENGSKKGGFGRRG